MTRDQARQVLLPYRPGTVDERDPKFSEALELVRGDAELARWFQEHCAFQRAMRAKLQQIAAPADLRERILAAQAAPKIIRPIAWWRQPAWMAAAAAVVLLLGLAAFWRQPRASDRFANFQTRMVSTALREYRMDLVTNDMTQVRQFLRGKGAPGDYEVTKGLAQLHLTGCGLLRWRGNPVSMVCFDRGDKEMLFLFVVDRSAVKDPPAETPQVSRVNQLLTVSWVRGDKAYLLAGPEESEFVQKYL